MIDCIDITKALATDGWMSEQELLWLAEQASKHEFIVEIGSYLGRSTRALLDNVNGMVFAVDDWKGPRDVYMAKEEREGLYQKFLDNQKEYVGTGKLAVIPCDHSNLPLIFERLKPDMVFIDGSHEYTDVKRDIEYWLPKIKQSGLICGHDATFSTVQQAVLETLGDVEVADNTTIWYKVIE